MLFSTRDSNKNVALEACKFWLTFAEDPDLGDHLRPLLPRIAPVLLACMVYGEDEPIRLASHNDDADVLNRLNEANDGVTKWDLRKCAAATIDVTAVRFGVELWRILTPHLRHRLWSTDWVQRESRILALGAMAEGCIEAIKPYLPELIPFLVNTLSDSQPLVRSITCWTLGRYATWCASNPSEEHKNKYCASVMEGRQLLRMVLDNTKRVQEAACSALARLVENAGSVLELYVDPILRSLAFAL
ncbi:hypothetical protein FRC07_014026 [Ceratobasidium sp. 392]|nr:hypothetical protein FRC07_014026 [Ceratobasidium sp. 392]